MASHENESMPNFLIFDRRIPIYANGRNLPSRLAARSRSEQSNRWKKNGKNTKVDRWGHAFLSIKWLMTLIDNHENRILLLFTIQASTIIHFFFFSIFLHVLTESIYLSSSHGITTATANARSSLIFFPAKRKKEKKEKKPKEENSIHPLRPNDGSWCITRQLTGTSSQQHTQQSLHSPRLSHQNPN